MRISLWYKLSQLLFRTVRKSLKAELLYPLYLGVRFDNIGLCQGASTLGWIARASDLLVLPVPKNILIHKITGGECLMKTTRRFLIVLTALAWELSPAVAQDIFVNQSGYLPGQQKLAYFSQAVDSFYVLDSTNNDIVFRGKPSLLASNDPSTGLTTYAGDFSLLDHEGTYRIATGTADTSYAFHIAQDAFSDVFRKSVKGFYFQRCGTPLLSQYAGAYARSTCHTNDGVFHSTTGESGPKVTIGGWHDAGDYGKYVVNAGISVGTLLMAYEQFPSKFGTDNLSIPESGNSIPDLLDEVRYELEWLLEMQDSADGGVCFKVTAANFAGFIMPASDGSTRYIYQKSTTATGDLGAVMAMAARIYSAFDTSFASRCLTAATKAWKYLLDNPMIVPAGGFHNPSGTYTGEYGDGNDTDERLWAATELFITTGGDSYLNYFKDNYSLRGVIPGAMGWPNVQTLAQLDYAAAKRIGMDFAAKAKILSSLKNYCNTLVATASADGFHVTLNPSDYYWGSNSVALNNAVLLIMANKLSPTQSYYNTALDQLNYVLGCNMHDMTFVTGVGSKSPMHIHHRPSAADGIAAPIPGLISGGPDRGLDDSILQSHFTSSTPPAECYVDDQGSYASNEICLNWNAPLVFVAGYLNEMPATPVSERRVTLPSDFSLAQNYPNPFNPTTVIRYGVPSSGSVSLKIYDVLGRLVKTLVSGVKRPGNYEVQFNGSDLSTGVYFYRFVGGSHVITRKMLLLN